MKKKVFGIILSLMLVVAMLPTVTFATPVDNCAGSCTHLVAIGTTHYDTLEEAIEAANGNATVKLLQDVNESVVVANGKTVTIDLNGKTLTNNNAGHTITVNVGGVLTVNDSSAEKSGKVQTQIDPKGQAALYNDGTVVVNGGLYTRNGVDTIENMFYVIHNNGNMTINENVIVEGNTSNTGSRNAATVSNAWIAGAGDNPPSAEARAILTINGGTFKGGNATLKNNSQGEVIINDGKFMQGRTGIHNYDKVTIKNGTFSNNIGAVIFVQNDGTDRIATVDFYDGIIHAGTLNGGGNPAFNAAEKTLVNIHGGVINGKIGPIQPLNTNVYKVYGGLSTQSLPASTFTFGGEVIEVNGSKYDNDITKIMVNKTDNILVRYGDYYGVGMETVNRCLNDSVTSGKTVDVFAQFGGSKTLNAPVGAKISNSDVLGGAELIVNGKTVARGSSHTVPPAATITEGHNSQWEKESTTGLKFRSTANFDDFTKVEIDGAVVNEDNYNVEDGSTIVTLKPEYLNGLSVGGHTIVIVSGNDRPEASFTVKAAAVGPTQPSSGDNTTPSNDGTTSANTDESAKTGDSSNLMGWIILMAMAIVGGTATVSYRRKNSVK